MTRRGLGSDLPGAHRVVARLGRGRVLDLLVLSGLRRVRASQRHQQEGSDREPDSHSPAPPVPRGCSLGSPAFWLSALFACSSTFSGSCARGGGRCENAAPMPRTKAFRNTPKIVGQSWI